MKAGILFAVIFLLSPQHLHALDTKPKRYELKGYLKDLQMVSFVDDADSLLSSNLIHNRLNTRWNLSKDLFLRLELRTRIYYGETVKLIPDFGKYISRDAGFFNLTKLWVDKKSIVAVSSADRALLSYSNERISVTAGRQRINWGVNTIWNPNDIFNAYNFLDFDYEERPGADAIRIQYYPKSLSSVEIAYSPSKESGQSIAAALLKINKWKYDFQFLAGSYHDDFTMGLGWAGNIKEAGFKGEATYFRSAKDLNSSGDDFTASVLFDYSLKNAWYLSVSFLYVQHPASVLRGPLYSSAENISIRSLMPYRYSYYAGIMKSFSPIFSGSLAMVYSPSHNSTIFLPALTYGIAENFELELNAQSFFSGQSGEYQTQGNEIFLRLKWNF